ncbi:Na+/melibiose symporter [Pilibacter termitis]|uniref:Na+/melibiose symporter n=1 Tax=Pilibacter termitis TaxID=263852 RepID=A0A1T4RFP3_9ENTE|nr:MFS transporter [Pilibacter termitis]SKA14795.1 Na+/melibiose symporter [Pilibacter termitis]
MKLKKYFLVYHGLPKNVYFVCLNRLFSSLIIFVYPLLTNYITLKLGATDAEAGGFVSIALLVNLFSIFIGGFLGDKYSAKNLLLFGQFALSICSIACSLFIGKSIVVAFLIILSGIFGFTNPLYNVLILDNSKDDLNIKKRGFSLLYFFLNLGVAIGPLLSGMWFEKLLPLYFLSVGISNLVMAVLFLAFYKQNRSTTKTPKKHEEKLSKIFVETFKNNHLAIKTILFSILNYFIYIQISYGIPIQLNDWFHDGPKIYGLLMLINAILVLTLTPIISGITHNLNPIFLMSIGSLFYMLSFLSVLLFSGFVASILFISICTIGEILIQTNISLVVSILSEKSMEGRMNSYLLIISSFGNILGTSMFGFLITQTSLSIGWLAITILSVIYAGLMYQIYLASKRKKHI